MLYNATYLGVTPVGAIVDDAGGALTDVNGTVLLPSITRPVTLSTLKGVVIQYNPATGEDGHFVAFDVATAIADWKAFITSYFATGTPAIP